MLRKLLSNAAKFNPAGTAIEVSIGRLSAALETALFS